MGTPYDPTSTDYRGRTPEQIDDLVKSVQENIIRRKALVNLMTDLTHYYGLEKLYRNHKKVFGGGLDWRFDVLTDDNKSARHVGLYETDKLSTVDGVVTGKVGPRFTDASYSYDIHEPALNGGNPVQIYEFVKTKMAQMKMSAYNLLETDIWGTPTRADDKLTPYGIAFWIQKTSGKNDLGGFYGLDPQLAQSATVATPTAVARAGISSGTVARWKNWAANYGAVSKDDLVKKMRYAALKTDFRSPISMAEPTLSSGNDIVTNADVIMELESILEAQNMNLGNDVASKDGKCLFKGRAVNHAPKLDDDASNPVYMLDWSSLAIGMVAGWDEKLTAPAVHPTMHNVRQVFMDGGWNMVCTNLRKQAVISKTA